MFLKLAALNFNLILKGSLLILTLLEVFDFSLEQLNLSLILLDALLVVLHLLGG